MKLKKILHYDIDDPCDYPDSELTVDFRSDVAKILYSLIDVCKTYDVHLSIDTLARTIKVIHNIDGANYKYCNVVEDIYQTEKICKNCRYVVETPDNSKPNLVCSIFGTYAILDDFCDNFERKVE